jgi:hypothetical protein
MEYNSKKRARFTENPVKKWCRYCNHASHDTAECKHLLQQQEILIRNQKQKPGFIKKNEYQARKSLQKKEANAFHAAVEAAVKKSMEAYMTANAAEKDDHVNEMDAAYNNFLAESKLDEGEIQEEFNDEMVDEDDEQSHEE